MRTTRAIFFLVHHEPKKHSSCLKNGLKCCIPKKNGTEKENRTSIRMTVRVERWGGIIDADRDRYVTWVPAQNRPIVRIRDRPRYRRSCSRDVLWLLNAQWEGKVDTVFLSSSNSPLQSSTLHNSPSSSVQQRAVILRAVIFFILTRCNMAQFVAYVCDMCMCSFVCA